MLNIEKLIAQGEGITLEFKRAKSELPSSLFETVCAFLNRYGGDILLGISDKGEIEGINPKYIQKLKKDIVNALNNAQLMNPPVYLIPEERIISLHIHGKILMILNCCAVLNYTRSTI
jgi:ATP-dependent DNA helicase RecG